jgi:hypothetical protein
VPVDEPQPTEVQIHVGEFIRINDSDREAGGSMSGSTVVGCKQGHPKRVTLVLIHKTWVVCCTCLSILLVSSIPCVA